VTITPAGKAQPGDVFVDDRGELRELVSVISVGTWLDQRTAADIDRDPSRLYTRGSTAGLLVSMGAGRTGREKRDHERWLAKVRKRAAA